jgi:DNA-binding CsgD family transcriptional regulator
VLDDVHLADASSWEALQYLANNLAESRLLVVVAARPAELSEHELASRVLIGLDQEGFLTRLDLKPLDMEALSELTQAVVGQAPPPVLVDWLGQRSRGNPLFTIGLLRALEEEGADLTSPQLHRVPEALADRVTQRLKGLDEPARAVIEVLSVLGRRVELGELAELGTLTSEALGCVLEQLVRSGLVSEDERGAELTYEISHPLIQEAIYESIGRARRRPLHRRIGRAMLTAGRLGEAARHYAASAEPGDAEAVDALCDALRQAEGRAAYRESLTILGSIVNILAGDDQRWLRVADAITWKAEWVIDHRADAHALLGIEALRAIDKALAHSADSSRRAAVKLRLGTFLSWGTGELDEAERALLEAGGLFAAAGEQTQAMLARLELAFLAGMKGRLVGWIEEARSVAEIAEAEGDRLALMHSVGRGIGFGAWYVGSFGESEAAFHRALAIATEDGKAYFQTLCLGGLALTLAMAGRVHEALPLLAQAKAVNAEWRDSLLLEYQAMAHWLAGDFHSALHSAEESAAWNPTGLSRRRGIGLAFAVLSAIETGQLAEARHHLARAEAAYGGRDWFFYRPYFAYAGAVLAWRAGDGTDALARLRRAASEIAATRATPFAALAFLDLTEMAAEADRADMAQEAAARLEELAAGLDSDLYRALAALASSWTALASGAPARGAGPARRAVDLLAPTGCRAFSGRATDALGRALSEGDRPGAVTALEQAVSLFEACGATGRRDRSLERLRQLGAPGRRAAGALSGPASLTRRERQVARLAAQGHTVRQIGERLYISERTVETHLSAVYAKLGVASKTELVSRAAELD